MMVAPENPTGDGQTPAPNPPQTDMQREGGVGMQADRPAGEAGGTLSRPSPAKVNLYLDVVGKRADGYHDLVSVFQEIDLHDTLHATLSDEDALTCDTPGIPLDGTNLILRALKAFRRVTGATAHIAFHLQKRIPVGGGLGGGSGNAATALRLADALCGTRLSTEALAAIGAEVGSDVPFFLYGGTCLCEGRGERIRRIESGARGLPLLLILPPWGISTAAAYGAFSPQGYGQGDVGAFLDALASGDAGRIAQESLNRFEDVLDRVDPREMDLLRELREAVGCCVHVSGSGAGIWALPQTPGQGAALRKVAEAWGAAALPAKGCP